jgi:hypothetical protein
VQDKLVCLFLFVAYQRQEEGIIQFVVAVADRLPVALQIHLQVIFLQILEVAAVQFFQLHQVSQAAN